METLVVYFSKFGYTQRLAETIALELSRPGPASAISAAELPDTDLTEVDVVIMGTPTHKMNLPEAVRPVLNDLPRRCLRGKLVAAFDTSYAMNGLLNRFVASKRLDRKLRRLGGRQAVAPAIFVVTGREGPLADGELERARSWAQGIAVAAGHGSARPAPAL